MSKEAEVLNELTKKFEAASDAFSKQAETATNEAQKAGRLSEETKNEVDKLATTFNTMSQALNQVKSHLGELEGEFTRMTPAASTQRSESAGQIVINNEAVKQFAASLEPSKRLSVPVQNALLSADVPGSIIEPTRLPGIDAAPRQRLFIRDLILGGRTNSNTIYWVQQTGFTNRAAAVPENTTKPYSDIAFEEKMTPVRTLAHMFKASKQILDDMAQLQSTVDGELRYGLKYVEEGQILFGDGTGANLEGIVPQASAFAPAFAVENQTVIDVLRLAMLQGQLARLPSSGHVLHYVDWAQIELTKDSMGRYILANPLGLAGPVLWGLPVVATEIAAFRGKFLTGAFNSGAQIFDREDANVVISTENVDDFEKNMISIRCEERLALVVKRPEAFVFGDFTTTAPAAGA